MSKLGVPRNDAKVPYFYADLWVGQKRSKSKNFFSPESSASWLDEGHKNFSILAILARVIRVQKIVQIWHSGGDFGQV